MAITRTTMIDDDGTGLTGTIINNAWKQELYNQIDLVGTWQDVPFAAGNFIGTAGMTWTVAAGQVVTYAYAVNGKTVTVSFFIDGSTIGGTPASELQIALPITPTRRVETVGWALAGVAQGMRVFTLAATPSLFLYRVDNAAWPAGTASVHGQIALPIA